MEISTIVMSLTQETVGVFTQTDRQALNPGSGVNVVYNSSQQSDDASGVQPTSHADSCLPLITHLNPLFLLAGD